ARRGGLSGRRAERFSDREAPVWERRPEFARVDDHPGLDDDADGGAAGPSVGEQAAAVASLLAGRGWPGPQARVAVEVVLRRLADCGSRPAAYERLRREKRWRAVCGLPQRSWTGLLRLLLGDPADRAGVTAEGRGVMLRLALGETLVDLREDGLLGRRIDAAAPSGAGGQAR
ncbi:MAG: hypothetical protein LBL01_06290, partial [Bifidobacteriaceae bacterium]|nr:hypothetical protein [Bifidobacteriaceae bacterium]